MSTLVRMPCLKGLLAGHKVSFFHFQNFSQIGAKICQQLGQKFASNLDTNWPQLEQKLASIWTPIWKKTILYVPPKPILRTQHSERRHCSHACCRGTADHAMWHPTEKNDTLCPAKRVIWFGRISTSFLTNLAPILAQIRGHFGSKLVTILVQSWWPFWFQLLT